MNQPPKWISHRGLKERATENTLQAFQDAVAAGYTHLETDLRTTADGQIVLAHDASLERVFGLSRTIEDCTADELRRITDAHGHSLLFFDDFMTHFGQLEITLDIKPEQGMRTLDALQTWLKAHDPSLNLLGRTRFLFWDSRQQAHWLDIFPQSICLANEHECMRAGLAMALRLPIKSKIVPGKTYALPPRFGILSIMRAAVVARYHRAGARVIAYLPPNEHDLKQAITAGVDEILCDGRKITL